MNTEEKRFLNDFDRRLWDVADRLRFAVNPGDDMHAVLSHAV